MTKELLIEKINKAIKNCNCNVFIEVLDDPDRASFSTDLIIDENGKISLSYGTDDIATPFYIDDVKRVKYFHDEYGCDDDCIYIIFENVKLFVDSHDYEWKCYIDYKNKFNHTFVGKEIKYIFDAYFEGKWDDEFVISDGVLVSNLPCYSKLEIPNSVKKIISRVDPNFRKVYKEIIVPASVEEFSSDCFDNCENLENVVFEEGSALKSIPDRCFCDCHNLKSINLPDSIKYIGYYAFARTKIQREAVSIPENCTVNDNAFVERKE